MTDKESFAALLAAVHDNPTDKLARLVLADLCSEIGHAEWESLLRSGKIPLTPLDMLAVNNLCRCNFAPATWDKKFARSIGEKVGQQEVRQDRMWLTVKQYLWMWMLCWRYRRSATNQNVVEEAGRRYRRYVDLAELRDEHRLRVSPAQLKKEIVKEHDIFNDQPGLFDGVYP